MTHFIPKPVILWTSCLENALRWKSYPDGFEKLKRSHSQEHVAYKGEVTFPHLQPKPGNYQHHSNNNSSIQEHTCVCLSYSYCKSRRVPYKVNELTVQREQGERYEKSCLTVWVPDSFECLVVWLTKSSQRFHLSLSHSEKCHLSHETTTHHTPHALMSHTCFCSSSSKYARQIDIFSHCLWCEKGQA